LRPRPGIRVTDTGDGSLWLRGDDFTEEIHLELRKLPGARRFTVGAGDEITEVGKRIPAGVLPRANWTPLAEWLRPRPQPAALSGVVPARVPLRLVRASEEHPANLLLTAVHAWSAYATSAPAARLRPLRFAVAADGRAVIWGTPLPPIPGRRYAERDGIAVPCGFSWGPPVEPAVLREVLQLDAGDLALLDETGACEHIESDHFARASRAAVRATVEASGVRR
jgi:hypothetical protein